MKVDDGSVQNLFGVGVRPADGVITILNPPVMIAREQALMFAAFIVALAEKHDGDFDAVLERVRNT
jgi:hypothetical protein